ncbi:MAG: SusD/RagB family nutrient-binding outer membrane lipoprotein, partial [Bacteroidota bacterium]|nr:SusD/RagB family nutrient-binding outer membrane lipoprotein [Bacteroidota bacterium]
EDWDGNFAGKVMIDHMNTNTDPRLRVMFQPGTDAEGAYFGIDPMMNSSAQNAFILTNKVSRYNWSTLSRNQFFPGILINTPEVNFLVAEAYLNANNDAKAKEAYEAGIANSVKYYYLLRSVSNNNESGTVTPVTDAEIADYIAKDQVSWGKATSKDAKLKLIATQKWIHFSVVQPLENWSEVRRLDYPAFSFEVDQSDAQKQPPYRWQYPDSEKTYNKDNYATVSAKDKITNKIFWDVK